MIQPCFRWMKMKSRAGKRILLALGSVLLSLMGGGLLQGGEGDVPRFNLILAARFRFEAWDNAINLDDGSDEGFAYTRNKITFGLQWSAGKNLEITGKLTDEFRVYFLPKDRPFNWHEIFFDNLYVKWKLPGRIPFTLTVGRQDIFLGEGFVIADATPLDGSRSFYFNAVRADYDPHPDHKIIVFFHATNRTDRFLPVIHDQDQPLVEQPERALAVYYSGGFGKLRTDAYCIWKNLTQALPAWPGSSFSTLGGRIQAPIASPLLLTVEGAFQTGSSGDTRRLAYGGITHLDWTPRWKIPFVKTLVLGGIYLSGDRPETERLEAWDPVFSRWPKWSDGYLLTFTRESRPAYWSNMTSVYGSVLLDFGGRANAALNFYRLGADQSRPGVFPGGEGLDRGFLMVHRLNFVISRNFTGYLHWEGYRPGGFYFPGASGFDWIRIELHYRY